ncbi:MAG: hypothetical protein JAY75_01055 [Candidatus Thiodiazotropha taylori]|nr:hypothetical protein [Candidatus Thiodiazotropha taylori]MCW4297074.1 hypothetical protein [Candidatus Thiodiazotropha endolucinida]MCG8115167.1 hypothetical protein [Candidatus Thiodiazotropha taylori]MCG8121381.1 hypothetical protein [Candidatus Thiodiazotropha taylori]MCW4299460.1 hypothetical protein [Candidatus Thiodiazotropha endolucinida]
MRKPDRNKKPETSKEDFLGGAEGHSDQKAKPPWKRNLNKIYDKGTGKVINVRLPEHYSECLQWLAEKDSRSQHKELVHLLCSAIDKAVSK